MKYIDKLKNYVGRVGEYNGGDGTTPYCLFTLYPQEQNRKYKIKELGDDYIIIQNRESNGVVIVPLSLFVLRIYE